MRNVLKMFNEVGAKLIERGEREKREKERERKKERERETNLRNIFH